MTDSILDSVKTMLGVPVESTDADSELMLHINSVLSNLNQLGVGPLEGFMITDSNAVWADLLSGNMKMNDAKTYVFLRVKMLFDPPTTSFALDAMKEQVQEAAWRLNVTREQTDWVNPNPPVVLVEDPTLF